MAQKHVICDLNLNGNEIKNVVLEVLASAPEAKVGKIYYDSTIGSIGYCTNVPVSGDPTWVYTSSSHLYDVNTISDDLVSSAKTLKIYQTSSDSTSGVTTTTTFTLRALKEGTNISLSKTAVASGADEGKEYITISINPETSTTLGGDSASNDVVPSQLAVKTYVDNEILKVNTDITGAMHFIGTWDGEDTIEDNITASGLTKLRKGDYWIVSNAVAHSAIPVDPTKTADDYIESATGTYGLEVGDMIIAISDRSSTSAIVKADFKVIDNSESADLVRTGNITKTDTLNSDTSTNKTTIPSDYTVGKVIENVNANSTHYYKTVINTAVSTATVTASTHGCGLFPEVKVYQAKTESNVTTQNEVVAQVSLNASGDVTVSWNGAITVDQGTAVDPITIVIVGKVESAS